MEDIRLLNRVQGKEIEVLELRLFQDFEVQGISLSIICLCENQRYMIQFANVSHLKIENFSYPLQICGFEIRNNRDRGWDSHAKYTVNDFEDGTIAFYCENIVIKDAEPAS